MAYSPDAMDSLERVRRVDAGSGVQIAGRAQQMGRHRRSATTATAEEQAGGTERSRRGHRRKRSAAPVRTGLVGVSAALAVGAVAMTSGLLPGGDTYTLGRGGSD